MNKLPKEQFNRIIILVAALGLLTFLIISSTASFKDPLLQALFPKKSSFAASYIWDGGGTTNNWSEAANWSADIVPATNDFVTFNNTSTKNVTIDVSITVSGINVQSTYTGILTQAPGVSVTLAAGGYNQAAGTFNGSDGTINISGSGVFNLTGGTFNNTTGTFNYASGSFSAANFTVNGGTFNNTGSLVFYSRVTVSCSGTLSGTVSIIEGNDFTFTNSAGCTLTVSSITGGGNVLNNGTINHIGTVFDLDDLFTNGKGGSYTNNGTTTFAGTNIILEGDFAQNGTFDLTGKTITFDGSNQTDNTIVSCSGSLGGLVVIAKSSPGDSTFTLNSGCTITVNAIDGRFNIINNGTINHTGTVFNLDDHFTNGRGGSLYNNASGVINFAGTDISLEGDLTQNGTFNLTGITITFDGSDPTDNSTVICSGTLPGFVVLAKIAPGDSTFTNSTGCTLNMTKVDSRSNLVNRGTINHTGTVFNLDDDLNVGKGGTLTNNAGGVINYTGTNMSLEGDFNQLGTFNLTGITITFDGSDPTDNSTANCSGSLGGSVIVAKIPPGDSTFTNVAGCTLTVSKIDSRSNVVNNGTINHTGTVFNLDDDLNVGKGGSLTNNIGGVINFTSCNQITLEGDLVQNGTFNANGITITFDGSNPTDNSNVTSTTPLYNIIVNKVGNITASLTINSDLTVNNFNRIDGIILNPAIPHILNILGDFSMATTDLLGGANLTFNISGDKDQLITQSAGTLSSPFVINKPSGTVNLLSSFTLANDLTLTKGVINMGNFGLTTPGILTITEGGLRQGSGNLGFGTLSIGSFGYFANQSTGDITVGVGGVTNSGTLTIDGGGLSCDSSDDILIRSNTSGTQRNWTGSGIFQLYDVNVQDQAGTVSITANSSTDTGNNGSNWTFNTSCPAYSTTIPALPAANPAPNICALTPPPPPVVLNPPVCSFTGPTTIQVGQTGSFSSTSSGDINSSIWTTPDGTPLSGLTSNFNWTPSTSGTQPLTLTISGPDGEDACTTNITVTPAPTPPVCSFDGPTSLQAGQPGTYTSTSTGNNLSLYSWAATGGTPISSINSTFTWTPATDGVYTISLTVTDDLNATDSCDTDVTVTTANSYSQSSYQSGGYSEASYSTGSSYSQASYSSTSTSTFTPIIPSGGPATGRGGKR